MAALFTLLLSMCAIIIGYFLYDFSQKSFLRETEAAIDNEIENILSITYDSNQKSITSLIEKKSKLEKHPIYFYQDINGKFLAGNIKKIPQKNSLIKEGVVGFKVKIKDHERQVAAKIHTFPDGSRLLVARNIHDILKSYKKLQTLSVFIIIFMLMVVMISFFISSFVVSRINKITNTARQIINTGDLSKRISLDSNWDDLSYLSETLNHLLEKVESLMQSVKQVSDNIAHDLKTPITRLRGDIESLQGKKLSDKEISKLIDEADRILNIFNSLLRIANIEKGKSLQYFVDTDLSAALNDVVELYEPLALENNIKITYDEKCSCHTIADKDMLFQMFANLMDNAIKFSPKDSEINLTLKKDENYCNIVISDGGLGIDKHEQKKVFERFYRADKSRNTQGSGLGLSMVIAIVELHKGSIWLSDNNPGLNVNIDLPILKNND
jgi:signal transduction histidine kinase